MKTSPKVRKFAIGAVKTVLLGILVAAIWTQLRRKTGEVDLVATFTAQWAEGRHLIFLAVLALMPLNWMLEGVKWRVLVRRFQPDYTALDGVRSVLCGVMLGFITPNKMGEFAGRLAHVQRAHWPKGITAGFWGGVAQFIVTYTVGVIFGLYAVHLWLQDHVDLPYGVLVASAVVTIAIACWTLLHLPRVIGWLERVPWIGGVMRRLSFQFTMQREHLGIILLITLVRYLVYVHQYILLFGFYGMDIGYGVLFQAVVTMLVLHTIIPSVPIMDLGVKGGVLAWLLIPAHTENLLGALSVIITIWIVNLMVPAIVGYLLILRSDARDLLRVRTYADLGEG